MKIKLPFSLRNLFFFVSLLISFIGYSQANPQIFTTSGTFTVPVGITQISVETWGGGGRGGTRTSNGGGGGGGGGAYASATLDVTPGAIYTITVGAGSSTVSAGGDSSFRLGVTTFVLAKGGNSVADNSATFASGGLASSCVGTVKNNGGSGANGSGSNAGGGGSSAGTLLIGTTATNQNGALAPFGGGNGGNGRTASQGNGVAASSVGGGGGGGYRTSSGTRTGGRGGNGQVKVSWKTPVMEVKGNGILILDGSTITATNDNTDFGELNLNSTILRTFVISNSGNLDLNLYGSPIVNVSGSSDFTVTIQPNTLVTANGTTTFQIAFSPLTLGVKTAEVSITNDDASKNPYNFKIQAIAIQAFQDSDGDGVYDNIDLDDDNDGIPDSIEQNYASGSVLSSTVEVTLLNETFGSGTNRARININVPTASTTYCYEDGTTAMAVDECDATADLNDGQYTISNTAQIATWAATYWYTGADHTPSDTDGRMALFNATNDITDEFYRTIVQGVTTNVPLTYSFWVLNLDKSTAPGIATRNRPNINVEFRDLSNNVIASLATEDIAPTNVSNANGDWYNFTATFVPQTTGFSIVFKNNQPGGLGNDLALDDIKITQILTDTDRDGIPDVLDLDSDNDGIGGIVETGFIALSNGLDRMDLTPGIWIDQNFNGWHDTAETYFTNNLAFDTDGDGVPDYLDLDTDNDGKFDVDEAGLLNGDGDSNGDGKGNGVDMDKDGILDVFDNYVGFGNSGKPAPMNTLGTGNYDYMKVVSQTVGVYDIATTLYVDLDISPVDGVIDGSFDVDRDGILDTFDTNTNYFGSPRDLNRKLYLDFDGRNDYGQNTAILGGLSAVSLMGWININPELSTDGVIIGQDKFQIRITSARELEAIVNGVSVKHAVALNKSQWYNIAAVYNSTDLKLFLNGELVKTEAISGSIASDSSLLTIGRNPILSTSFFKGKMDELRVFNVALTDSQLQKMVYQEIQNITAQVRGAIIPKAVPSLPFASLLRYYRMDTYKDDIVDDLTTSGFDIGTGMRIYNHKNIYTQQAPMPFITERTGNFADAVDSPSKEIRGLDCMEYDWSIVNVKHNISEITNTTDLGMIVDPSVTIVMNNDTKIQNDWYLKLDGKIDLVGKSQLVQTTDSDLDVTSAGFIERDQQGQTNKFNYNYWSSPVSAINTTINNTSYTVASVMKDGTNPNTIQNILWTTSTNSLATSPITLSSYWIFKFQNVSSVYANWSSVGQNGSLQAGQGFTLKGSNAASATQNYTFKGKPNSGLITTPIAANNSNLSGNPYPSALDANAFIIANTASGTNAINGTLYFWEHFSTNTTHVLSDYQGGYATRTIVGGTPPIAPAYISGLGSSSKVPQRFIPVGQGFFLKGSSTGGTIVFDNSQRIFIKENHIDSNTLFRSANPTVSATVFGNNDNDFVEQDTFKRVRLGLTSANNYHRQILIGFMDQHATSGIDNGYDGIHIDNQPNDMYFINGTTKLAIQGEGFFNENNIYPITVKNSLAGNVKFMLDATENFEDTQAIYIHDASTNMYHNIKTEMLEISLSAGLIENRFSLRFNDAVALGVNQNELNNGIIIFHANANGMLGIKNNLIDTNVKSVELYNILGQKITTWDVENQDQKNIQLFIKDITKGTYIVKIITDKGNNSKKIIVQ